MIRYPIHETFGLSFTDIMSLPLDEWTVLREQIKLHSGRQTKLEVDGEKTRSVLIEFIKALASAKTGTKTKSPVSKNRS